MNRDVGAIIFLTIYGTILLACLLLFILPSIIAFRRLHPNRWLILMVNIFLGGTGIGWGVALVWALHIVHLSGEGGRLGGGQSGLNLFAGDISKVRIEPSMASRTSSAASASFSTDSALNQIERLRALLDDGHIDRVEFDQLKAATLQRL